MQSREYTRKSMKKLEKNIDNIFNDLTELKKIRKAKILKFKIAELKEKYLLWYKDALDIIANFKPGVAEEFETSFKKINNIFENSQYKRAGKDFKSVKPFAEMQTMFSSNEIQNFKINLIEQKTIFKLAIEFAIDRNYKTVTERYNNNFNI